jgi:hypothetical protein
VTSNAKRSDLNIKTEGILMKSSVQYDGQEKILSMPNSSNSVWDRGPQHMTRQQRAEARCVPRQQNVDALEGQMCRHRKQTSGSETAGSVQQQPKSGVCSHTSMSSLAQPQSKSGTYSRRSRVMRGCQSKAFVERHSKSNVKSKRTLTKSSVEREKQARYEYPPVQQSKAPDRQVQHIDGKQSVEAHNMPRQEKVAALDNQAQRGGEERLRWTGHQQSTGDNCHTSRDARRVTGFGRIGRVSPTPKGAYWNDEDGWSSSGPEISAPDYGKELEVPGQGLDEQSDASNRMYELSKCSDKEPVMSEPVNGKGWTSEAEELDMHMACIQAVHHYPIDDELSEGEEPWPNMVGLCTVRYTATAVQYTVTDSIWHAIRHPYVCLTRRLMARYGYTDGCLMVNGYIWTLDVVLTVVINV